MLNDLGLSQRKGILIIGPSPDLFGGIAKYMNDLLNSSLSQDYNIHHLETGKKDSEATGLLSGLKRTWSQVKEFNRMIKQETNIEIVHIHTASGLSFWRYSVFIYLSKRARKKVLLHIHGAAFKEFFYSANSIKKHLITRIIRKTDALVALSEHWRSFFASIVPDSRQYVVVNTVKIPDINMVEHVHSKGKRKQTSILFFGLLVKRKGLVELLKALPHLLERQCLRLVVAGGFIPGEEELVEDLKSAAETYGDRLDVKIDVPSEEKDTLFLDADIFILPTHAEGLPIALLEAMSFGLPVVTTPVGAIPEVVKDGKNGFLMAPGDAVALTEKIIYLLDHPETRKNMGKNNIQKIKKHFSHNSMIQKINRIYQELLLENTVKTTAKNENK